MPTSLWLQCNSIRRKFQQGITMPRPVYYRRGWQRGLYDSNLRNHRFLRTVTRKELPNWIWVDCCILVLVAVNNGQLQAYQLPIAAGDEFIHTNEDDAYVIIHRKMVTPCRVIPGFGPFSSTSKGHRSFSKNAASMTPVTTQGKNERCSFYEANQVMNYQVFQKIDHGFKMHFCPPLPRWIRSWRIFFMSSNKFQFSKHTVGRVLTLFAFETRFRFTLKPIRPGPTRQYQSSTKCPTMYLLISLSIRRYSSNMCGRDR